MRVVISAVVALGFLPAGAAGQVSDSRPFAVVDAESLTSSNGRFVDQSANPAYPAAAAEHGTETDPLRAGWEGTRGERLTVRFENRYGAELHGELYRPRGIREPLPAVVVVPGFGTPVRTYEALSQQLAEHGYVVLAVEPQGVGSSDVEPDERFCGAGGAWREPQEAGLEERGRCAGVDGPLPPYRAPVSATLSPFATTPAFIATDAVSVAADFYLDQKQTLEDNAAAYESFRPRFAFAGIDAAGWLLSSANPWRGSIDGERLGIAGHSAGADGAVVAGNADRGGRFGAAVAWDTFGRPPAAMAARVPTLIQQSERPPFPTPWGTRPDPRAWLSYELQRRFAAAGVPSGLLALRGASHGEWGSNAALPGGGSGTGHQVALHQTVAWFDHFLKGARADRLTARVFDDTADRTSIGTGRYDAVSGKNVPYAIASDPVEDHLSRIFASDMDLRPAFAPGPEVTVAGRASVRRGLLRTNRWVRCPGPAGAPACNVSIKVLRGGRTVRRRALRVAPFATVEPRVRIVGRAHGLVVRLVVSRRDASVRQRFRVR